ncbi:MAG: hypothetical protein LUH40_01440 [Clostridiales bacterium]|nr:hypothetical protein [Clostridiales bacterium]
MKSFAVLEDALTELRKEEYKPKLQKEEQNGKKIYILTTYAVRAILETNKTERCPESTQEIDYPPVYEFEFDRDADDITSTLAAPKEGENLFRVSYEFRKEKDEERITYPKRKIRMENLIKADHFHEAVQQAVDSIANDINRKGLAKDKDGNTKQMFKAVSFSDRVWVFEDNGDMYGEYIHFVARDINDRGRPDRY